MEDALPVHTVYLSPFWMDEAPVTNSEFADFVARTQYKTIAERPLDPKDYPQVAKEILVPGSAVFSPPISIGSLANALAWWKYVPGAFWKQPEGPASEEPVATVTSPPPNTPRSWRG